MARTTLQVNREPIAVLTEGPVEVTRRAWSGRIARMKRQGWREDRRFFEPTSATVYFNDGDGGVAVLTLETD